MRASVLMVHSPYTDVMSFLVFACALENVGVSAYLVSFCALVSSLVLMKFRGLRNTSPIPITSLVTTSYRRMRIC